MFDISESVPLPSEVSKAKLHARRETNKIVKRFQEAYHAVYGKTPNVLVQDDWIKIETQKARVTKKRLLEMARGLEDRVL